MQTAFESKKSNFKKTLYRNNLIRPAKSGTPSPKEKVMLRKNHFITFYSFRFLIARTSFPQQSFQRQIILSGQRVDVHEKCEPQVSWHPRAGHLRVKRKLGVGFRGRLFFGSFFWRIKRKNEENIGARML